MAEAKETPKKGQGVEIEKRPVSWLQPWEDFGPFEFMQRFAEEVDHLFEDFGMGLSRRRRPSLLSRMFGRELAAKPEGAWSPRIEMVEREGQLVIRAELPGLNKEDLKVEVTDEAITIQGERKEEKKEERKGYYYNECRYGSFFRSIPLPEGADPSKATAEFRNGVLEVVLPGLKPSEKKSRQLEIRT